MELVEFMSNKECVVETFKVNGLIAKDNTVTEKGLMAIQFYLDMIEQKKPELENCQTAYMSCSEVEEWEKKNAAASVSFDSGGVVGKHSKKCTFYTLRFGCSFAAVNTIKPQLL